MRPGEAYVTDVPYVGTFIPELAPAWLDHVALVHGIAPPRRTNGYDWCDVGCGLGRTATILAATHASGRFVGIDLMATHIEAARDFARDAQVGNVAFHEADLAAPAPPDLPAFDYIVVHGVYTWVDAQAQAALRTFIARHLKPNGLLYISYNALPGRAREQAFQRLVYETARAFVGDSIERMHAALDALDTLGHVQPRALQTAFARLIERRRSDPRAARYLAHELMCPHWQALMVSDVRAHMADIGLSPVGSARLLNNHDAFVLRAAARHALACIADRDTRELARDVVLDTAFRRDVFVRGGQPIDDAERRARLLRGSYCLAHPARGVEYQRVTPAGTLRFDNAHARALVASLTSGPCRLVDVLHDARDAETTLANMLTLCAVGSARPVEGGDARVALINAALRRTLDTSEELALCVLPCGTAVEVDRALLRDLREATAPARGDNVLPAWLLAAMTVGH